MCLVYYTAPLVRHPHLRLFTSGSVSGSAVSLSAVVQYAVRRCVVLTAARLCDCAMRICNADVMRLRSRRHAAVMQTVAAWCTCSVDCGRNADCGCSADPDTGCNAAIAAVVRIAVIDANQVLMS